MEEIRSSMLLEFHQFLEGLANFRKFYKKPQAEEMLDERTHEFVSSCLEDLTPLLRSDLKTFYKSNAFYPSVFTQPATLSRYPDFTAFRKYLGSIDAQQFIELVLADTRLGGIDEGKGEEEKFKEMEKAYRALDEGESVLRSYREMKKYPVETYERFLGFLDRMYESFFKAEESFIAEQLEEIRPRHQRLLKEHRDEFMREIIKVDFTQIIHSDNLSYRFYLGYLNTGRISYYPGRDSVHCFYNYNLERLFDPEYDTHRKARFFKALADETRIEIVKLVARREYYAAELAEALSVTKATMSYHMNMLAAQNIVSIRLGENKRIYYRLKSDNLDERLESFVSSLKGTP